MKAFLVVVAFLGVASAQYDYTPPQQQFNAGGNRPTYGLPGHSPGIPVGPSEPTPVQQPQREQQSQGGYQQQQQQPQQQREVSSQGGYQQQPQRQVQSQGGYQQQQPQQQEQTTEAYTPQVFKHVYVHVAPDEPEDRQSRTIKVPGGDKHVNIIFVKTPSQSSSQQTEVILPEQDEHKNLVYVLLKKGENTADVKIRKPAAPQQQKPEVYFIKYNDQQKQQQQQSQGGYQQPQQQQQQNGGYQRQQSNGNQGYQQAPEGITAPLPIRTAAQVPSSGYGVPL